jgi:hypothetical protein
MLEKQTLDLLNHDRLASQASARSTAARALFSGTSGSPQLPGSTQQGMVRNGHFSHQAANGDSPADRLSAAGIV